MKLTKAKEIIQLNLKEAGSKMPSDVRTALIMHSGAVTRIEQLRETGGTIADYSLPGETKE